MAEAAADIARRATERLRLPPHSVEAEQSLLGAVLVNNEALYRVSDFLEPQHFFEPIHQQIYDIARSLMRVEGATSWVVLLDRTDATDSRTQALRSSLPPAAYEITPWSELADFYNKTVELFSRQVSVVRLLIALIVILSISNTLSMAVIERTTEIGTSLAIGVAVVIVISLFSDLRAVGNDLLTFDWRLLPLILIGTVINYWLRWLKWDYYLRYLRLDRNISHATSGLIFTAGLVMSVTPGKMGEVLKSFLLRQRNATPITRSAPIVLAERITLASGHDLAAASHRGIPGLGRPELDGLGRDPHDLVDTVCAGHSAEFGVQHRDIHA